MFCKPDSIYAGDREAQRASQIIEALASSPVLTVGERANFLEDGGNISLLVEGNKVRFEINLASAKQNALKISSKLLQLAKRIIEQDTLKNSKK